MTKTPKSPQTITVYTSNMRPVQVQRFIGKDKRGVCCWVNRQGKPCGYDIYNPPTR
jgi:hypothetical protein